MPVLVGIDGTGSDFSPGKGRDSRYDQAFANSFVRRICNRGGAMALYRRGPVGGGGGLVDAVNAGFNHVIRMLDGKPNEPVLLTGYSRGAAGVVAVAAALQRRQIPVQAMMLFDCVDRHVAIDAEVIPNNVAQVLHVRRDPDSSSRESFGNDGTRWNPPTVYNERFYMCTHGGMGGTPWLPERGQSQTDYIDEGLGVPLANGFSFRDGMTRITFRQDAWVSGKIWTEIQDFLNRHKFMG